ncbi:hypothetical protein IAT38_006360 [Cryptococcus sp. DSM 104549]
MPPTFKLLALFILTLYIPPSPSPTRLNDSLLFPLTLLFLPSSTLTSLPDPRPLELSRALTRLTLTLLMYALFGAVFRTGKRLCGCGRGEEGRSSGRELGAAVGLHLMAWRCVKMPYEMPEGAWGRPWDVVTVLGVGAGLICGVSDLTSVLETLGIWESAQPRRNWIVRVFQVILAIHRILLAHRILLIGLFSTTAVSSLLEQS